MEQRRKRVLTRTAGVTVISVVASYLLSYSARWALGMEFDWLAWIECFVIPVAIAVPIGWYVFSQAEKLRSAHEGLEFSHRELKRTHARLAFVSRHDQMTGILNRAGFLAQLEQCLERKTGGVLLVLDADHFKAINDRYGHEKGDEALQKIAKALLYSVRRNDIVGRIGGEEFAILLTSTRLTEAEMIAELVRLHVERIPWQVSDPDASRLTVSIGGTELYRRYAKTADALREADRCLYEAKRRGRNCVVFSYSESAVA